MKTTDDLFSSLSRLVLVSLLTTVLPVRDMCIQDGLYTKHVHPPGEVNKWPSTCTTQITSNKTRDEAVNEIFPPPPLHPSVKF